MIAYKLCAGILNGAFSGSCGEDRLYRIGEKTKPKWFWGPLATFDTIENAELSGFSGIIFRCEIKKSNRKYLRRRWWGIKDDVRCLFPGTIYADWVRLIEIEEVK